MEYMSSYSIALAVTTDILLDDDQVRDVAAEWAAATGFDLGMSSTSRDEPWLRVSGIAEIDESPSAKGRARARHLGADAAEALVGALAARGATVAEWQAIEVLSSAELTRRSRRPSIPPMVSAKELAELAGLRSVQRIYQYEADRKAGKRPDFPAPVLDGYWLRTVAEHWARTRKTKPGPAPRS